MDNELKYQKWRHMNLGPRLDEAWRWALSSAQRARITGGVVPHYHGWAKAARHGSTCCMHDHDRSQGAKANQQIAGRCMHDQLTKAMARLCEFGSIIAGDRFKQVEAQKLEHSLAYMWGQMGFLVGLAQVCHGPPGPPVGPPMHSEHDEKSPMVHSFLTLLLLTVIYATMTISLILIYDKHRTSIMNRERNQ